MAQALLKLFKLFKWFILPTDDDNELSIAFKLLIGLTFIAPVLSKHYDKNDTKYKLKDNKIDQLSLIFGGIMVITAFFSLFKMLLKDRIKDSYNLGFGFDFGTDYDF